MVAELPIQLRRVPYPYRVMIAICSDLDETPDRQAYEECLRFCNTTDTTAIGPGVGLEVGNTIYFDMPAGQFAYHTTDDAGREMIRTLIRSGHIDCLHSFGDLATTRAHAARALDELVRYDCRLRVWIDHGRAVSNFGQDIMQGHGDEPGHEAYHADLTSAFGVTYVWRGRVTSVIGQDVPPRLGGLWRPRHPLASMRTVAVEAAKQLLARRGNRKYALHAANRVLTPVCLRDGTAMYEFLRCNPHWGGVSSCDTGEGIGDVLTDEVLRTLERREGMCVLYTHLGKVGPGRGGLPPSAVAAFRRLASAQHDGRILVTTTRRLLDYCRARQEIGYSVSEAPNGLRIDVRTDTPSPCRQPLERCDMDGLTFYVRDPHRTLVTVDGREVADLKQNPPDHTGRPSVSLPWRRLTFPLS